jgi:hypothetical protein
VNTYYSVSESSLSSQGRSLKRLSAVLSTCLQNTSESKVNGVFFMFGNVFSARFCFLHGLRHSHVCRRHWTSHSLDLFLCEVLKVLFSSISSKLWRMWSFVGAAFVTEMMDFCVFAPRSFNALTWFSLWRSAALFLPTQPRGFRKDPALTFRARGKFHYVIYAQYDVICERLCGLTWVQPHCCRFVCLFGVVRAIFQLSGDCHHYRWQGCKFRPMLSAYGF